jgi:tetratricopeptide (TPR) repeat protein
VSAKLGRLTESVAAARRSIALVDALPEKFRLTAATTLLDLAGLEFELGEFAEAEKSAGRAAELFQAMLDRPGDRRHPLSHIFLADAHSTRAGAQRELGRDADARAAHVAAFREYRTILGKDQSPTARHFYARALVERAQTYERLPADRARADRDYTAAIDDIWKKLREQFPETPFYREWLATALIGRGRVRTAADEFEKAAKDLDEAAKLLDELTAKSPSVPGYQALVGRELFARGRLAAARGDAPGAASYYGRAVPVLRAALAQSPDNAWYRRYLAEATDLARPPARP